MHSTCWHTFLLCRYLFRYASLTTVTSTYIRLRIYVFQVKPLLLSGIKCYYSCFPRTVCLFRLSTMLSQVQTRNQDSKDGQNQIIGRRDSTSSPSLPRCEHPTTSEAGLEDTNINHMRAPGHTTAYFSLQFFTRTWV
jgi:hypothetical protein